MSLTTKQVKEGLEKAEVHFDTIGKNKAGNYVIRRGYFYRHGNSATEMANRVSEAGFEVVDSGDHWAAFRGGASTRQSSHFWVEFKVKEVAYV